MQDTNNFLKYNKLSLYKDGLKKFIDLQINSDNKWNKAKKNLSSNLSNLDYIVGILFLTEMNRYCKSNNISIHGYYITCALMNLFLKWGAVVRKKRKISRLLSKNKTIPLVVQTARRRNRQERLIHSNPVHVMYESFKLKTVN